MSRRARIQKRPVPPDPTYNSRLISMTIRRLMRSGKSRWPLAFSTMPSR